MTDTIIVRCATCGANLGEITFVPGTQHIGCDNCNGVTRVYISGAGTVETNVHRWGTIKKDD